LEALWAVKTTYPLVQQCQKVLNDLSAHRSVKLIWVPRHSGVGGNDIPDEFAREDSAHHFLGPKPALGISRQHIRQKVMGWIFNQYWTLWPSLTSTHWQAKEIILRSNLAVKTKLLSFTRMQSRAITHLLTGHNTLRRPFYIMRLTERPLCRKCGAEEETPAHVLCKCEALATLCIPIWVPLFGPLGC
jgi:hypothetical protein